jgi:hypothetical protein
MDQKKLISAPPSKAEKTQSCKAIFYAIEQEIE